MPSATFVDNTILLSPFLIELFVYLTYAELLRVDIP